MGIGHSPLLLLMAVQALVFGVFCVLRREAIRAFVLRTRPDLAARFRDDDAHRRFITFCGWALLALAAESSLVSLLL